MSQNLVVLLVQLNMWPGLLNCLYCFLYPEPLNLDNTRPTSSRTDELLGKFQTDITKLGCICNAKLVMEATTSMRYAATKVALLALPALQCTYTVPLLDCALSRIQATPSPTCRWLGAWRSTVGRWRKDTCKVHIIWEPSGTTWLPFEVLVICCEGSTTIIWSKYSYKC